MPLSGISTLLPIGSAFDQSPPRRPGLIGDLQADTKQDDATWGPEVGMPCAGEANNQASTLEQVAKMAALLKISVTIPNLGGPAAITYVTAIGSNPVPANFTCVRTPIGGAASGDWTISWPANTFPTAIAQPEATVNGTSPGMIAANLVGNTGMRVITQNGAGTATDLPFTVSLN